MLDLRVKELFFDRAAVANAVSRGRRTALNRIGGFVRTTAKQSIRKRKGVSPAGKPPYSHVGLLRNHIYYSYDPQRGTVIVGPALITGRGNSAKPIGATIPQVLEKSGRVRLVRKGRKPRIVTVAARPFMAPALEAGAKSNKLAAFWREVVR